MKEWEGILKYKMRKSPAVYNKLISLWSMLVVWQLQDHISIELPTYPAIFLSRLSVVTSINLCKIELSLLSQKVQWQLEERKPFIARGKWWKEGMLLIQGNLYQWWWILISRKRHFWCRMERDFKSATINFVLDLRCNKYNAELAKIRIMSTTNLKEIITIRKPWPWSTICTWWRQHLPRIRVEQCWRRWNFLTSVFGRARAQNSPTITPPPEFPVV